MPLGSTSQVLAKVHPRAVSLALIVDMINMIMVLFFCKYTFRDLLIFIYTVYL